jgi:hypothetical protein
MSAGANRDLQRVPAVAVELAADQTAPAGARRALEPLRGALPANEFVDVRLLVSELVVDELHSRAGEGGGTIRLAARLADGTLRVELVEGWSPDADPPARPKPGDPGWGIYLAQLLGDRWGAEPAADGTRIWVEKRIGDTG